MGEPASAAALQAPRRTPRSVNLGSLIGIIQRLHSFTIALQKSLRRLLKLAVFFSLRL
jgi:hypothetical protein